MALAQIQNQSSVYEKEEKFVLQLKQGKEEAYRYLFNKYYDHLCKIANTFVGDKYVAKSLVGDLFYHLWKERESFQISTSFEGYLYIAIRNRSLNYLKQAANKINGINVSTLLEDGGDTEALLDEFTGLTALFEEELDEKINSAIEALPKERKAVFRLSRFENLSYKEIAEKKGISINTVRYHIKNALASLREDLKDYFG